MSGGKLRLGRCCPCLLGLHGCKLLRTDPRRQLDTLRDTSSRGRDTRGQAHLLARGRNTLSHSGPRLLLGLESCKLLSCHAWG